MRRIFLHVWFWVLFFVYDTVLMYTWMGGVLKGASEGTQLLMAIKAILILLPVDFLLVYYLIGTAAKKILSEHKRMWLVLLEMLVVFSVSVILFRLASYYVINPYVYKVPNAAPLISSRNLFVSILEMGYIGGIAFAIKLYRLQEKAKEREKDLVKEKLETELKFLRNQTNPHFLFNTLNNIYALARKKSDCTAEVVLKLSELLSFILYESRKETVPVLQEVKIIEDYIALERLRYDNRLTVKVEKNIDNGAQHIAPLLLLPLVENAFKHGASETRFDSFIHTSIAVQKNNFSFYIENSVEMSNGRKDGGNIGLSSISRQLELMYREHSMKTENLGHRFKVQIDINLESYGKI